MHPLGLLLIVALVTSCPAMPGGLFQPGSSSCHSAQDSDTVPRSSPLAASCLDGTHNMSLLEPADTVQWWPFDARVPTPLHDRCLGSLVATASWHSVAVVAPRPSQIPVFLLNASFLI